MLIERWWELHLFSRYILISSINHTPEAAVTRSTRLDHESLLFTDLISVHFTDFLAKVGTWGLLPVYASNTLPFYSTRYLLTVHVEFRSA